MLLKLAADYDTKMDVDTYKLLVYGTGKQMANVGVWLTPADFVCADFRA